MELVGIDGARLGYWVLARGSILTRTVTFELTQDLSELFRSAATGSTLVVIDVPIGILSGKTAAAGRKCDAEARRVVGPRRSSVFTPPSRDVFGSPTQHEASRRNREACGLGLGCQAFGILSRIEAVDALMTPGLQSSVREGHPEVTFAKLKGGFLDFAKDSPKGEEERLGVLERHGYPINIDAERSNLRRSCVGRDDLVDAAAMLLSAMRVAADDAGYLGDNTRDSRGLLMQMWA